MKLGYQHGVARLWSALLAGVALSVAACGGASGPSSASSADAATDSTSGADVIAGGQDGAGSPGDTGGAPEDETVATDDGSGVDVVAPNPDAGTEPPPDGHIGSSCASDGVCLNDAVCLDWTLGYCTVPNCKDDAGCPDGAVCAEISAGTTACLAACDPDVACRPSYGCKSFTTLAGPRSACVGLDSNPSPAGGACAKTTGCDGAFSCLDVIEEGYCARVGCDEASPCPAATTCVLYNGATTCMRACVTTDDCLVGGAKERECAPLVAAGGTVANVCLPKTAGVGVGSQCSLDLQCESGVCRIVAEGKCVSSEAGCFIDGDCAGGAVCEIAPAYKKGVCTQACGSDVSCPGQSACVTAEGGSFCQNACKGLTDAQSCDKTIGERCLFGDPVASTASGGKYVCAVRKAGQAGEACVEDADCQSAPCRGTCAPTCPADGCPFPTTCAEQAGEQRCYRRCFSVADCPAGLTCATTATSAAKICIPK